MSNHFASHGEGASAHIASESDNARDKEGGSWRPHNVKHRPRRTAKARREQAARAHARTIQQLLKSFNSLQHRGSEPSKIGKLVIDALQSDHNVHGSRNFGGAYRRPASSGNSFSRQYMPVCRHHAAGRCSWGAKCRFAHVEAHYTYDNDYVGYDDGYMAEHNEGGEYNGADEHNDDCSDHNEEEYNDQEDHNYNDGDGYHNEDGPSNDNNARQYNHNEQGDKQDDAPPDEIDEIIQVLGALSQDPEAQQQALVALPPHLLAEVHTRCESIAPPHDTQPEENTTSDHDTYVDNDSEELPQLFDPISGQCFNSPVEFPPLCFDSPGPGTVIYDELVLDHNLRKTTWNFLATVNMNKKIARRELGDEAINITFNISISDPSPSVPLSTGICETYAAPAQGGHVGDCFITATIISGSQLGDSAAVSCLNADPQHGQTTNTILEHVRSTLALLPLEKRWDAYVALPYATRREILDKYPNVMCDEASSVESLSEPD